MSDFECPRCGHCCQSEVNKDMKRIKTWSERCEEHPDHQHGMISKSMIQARMQEEIDELRQALETEQEPVCWTVADGWVYANDTSQVGTSKEVNWEPLYTAPPKHDYVIDCPRCGHCCAKRTWVGLTDEEIQEVVSKKWWDWEDAFDIEGFSRAIERVLKEKNHGH